MDCWHFFDMVCVEKKVDLGNAILAIVGLLGLVSIYLTYRQLRIGQRSQQAQVAIQLYNDFMADESRRAFMYRLDYTSGDRAWLFEPSTFPHSEEERRLDILLCRFSFMGTLLKNGDIGLRDLDWVRSEVAIVLENSQVLKYLSWLKQADQLPKHSSYAGAIHLYEALHGRSGPTYIELARYLAYGNTIPAKSQALL